MAASEGAHIPAVGSPLKVAMSKSSSTPPPSSTNTDNLSQLTISPIVSTKPRKGSSSSSLDPLSQSFTFGTSSSEQPSFLVKIRSSGADLNATYPAAGTGRMRVCGPRGLRKLQGHGLDTISFSPMRGAVSTPSIDGYASRSEWGLRSMDASARTNLLAPGPSKSLLTIDSKGNILVANQNACELFGYKPAEITAKTLDMLLPRDRPQSGKVVSDLLIDDNGRVETVNGRVVEAVDCVGKIFTVSLHLTRLDTQDATKPRFMAVMEPVARESAEFIIDSTGTVIWCDTNLTKIYRVDKCDVVDGHISEIIPSLQADLPMSVQHVVTQGAGEIVLPATLSLERETNLAREKFIDADIASMDAASAKIFGVVHVYRNISGLITCNEEGLVSSCNDTFVLLLFGYTERQLMGKPVNIILPDLPLGPDGHLDDTLDAEASGPGPCRGQHRDGLVFHVTWQIKKILDKDYKPYFCLWVSRDPTSSLQLSSPQSPSLTENKDTDLNDFLSGACGQQYSVTESIGTGSFGTVLKASRRHPTPENEVIIKCIVKSKVLPECWDPTPSTPWANALDARVDENVRQRLPREVVLLMDLNHENIVKAIEVYHNADIFQLVFAYDGECMDLFKFIDDNLAGGDEQIIVYIFRQVTAGVAYLHEKNIVHRDIKDENVVLDNNYKAKLIDFGSAHYIEEGKLFDTFCGTLEYCAPEVLLGNPYAGKELDMFALGVTLYTLVFGERPFFDVEESIAGILYPPFEVNELCSSAILWILEIDPRTRASAHDILGHEWITQFATWIPGDSGCVRRATITSEDEDELDDELSDTYDRLGSA